MILDATNRKIQVVLAAAVAASQLAVVANWVDKTASATTPGASTTATNDTTQVDIVAAPAASTQRIVQSLSVYNTDTASATVSIIYDDNGTDRLIVKVTIQPGQSLTYHAHSGWAVPEGALLGASLSSFYAHKNNSDQGSITSGAYTKITFGTELWDIGADFDTANSRWTPPAGKVLLLGSLAWTAGTVTNAYVAALIYKNGSVYADMYRVCTLGGASESVQIFATDQANGTDYYEVYGYADGGGNKTVGSDFNGTSSYSTFFTGAML